MPKKVKEYYNEHQANIKSQRTALKQKLFQAQALSARIEIGTYINTPKIDKCTRS